MGRQVSFYATKWGNALLMYGVRKSARRATVALALAGIVGLTIAATPAIAVPSPIVPEFGLGAPPPPLTTGATGMELVAVDGVPVDNPSSFTVNQAAGATQVFTLRFREPPASSGQILDPRFLGTFTLTNTQIGTPTTAARAAAFSFYPTGPIPFMAANGQIAPIGEQYSDTALSVNDGESYNSVFDFSGLPGGVLPSGSILSAHEVDACNLNGPTERVRFKSSAGEAWMRYYSNVGFGPTGPVTFDSETGEYDILPAPVVPPSTICPDSGYIATFETISDRSDLSINIEGIPRASGRRWLMLAPTVPAAPAVGVVKTVNGQNVDKAPGPQLVPGQAVSWEFAVTNRGNVPLGSVNVTDDKVANVDCGDGTSVIPILAVGETITCRAFGTAENGPHTNIVSVTGQPMARDGVTELSLPTVSATDQSWFNAVAVNGLSISKVADHSSVSVGDRIQFTITVTNTGNMPVVNAKVTDILPQGFVTEELSGGQVSGQTIEWTIDALAPNESKEFIVSGRAPTTPGSLTNRVSVVAVDSEGTPVPQEFVTPCSDSVDEACANVDVIGSNEPRPPAGPLPSTGAGELAGGLGATVLLLGTGALMLVIRRRNGSGIAR